MTNSNTPPPVALEIFKAAMTKEELHAHVLTVQLVLVRQLHFAFCRPDGSHAHAQASLLGAGDIDGINTPDVSATELGLSYESIRSTALATDMEMLYDFAFHGMHVDHGRSMDSESGPSWTSRILYDLAHSAFAQEWNEYSECLAAISALLSVCETAHARLVLEGLDLDDPFMDWHGSGAHDNLTFRQMALLSGMSEASLRTMANPKHKNPLKTYTEGRNAYIEPNVARDWLISKGRYVPLVHADPQGAVVDLTIDGIRSMGDLLNRLDQRLHFLLGQDDGETVRKALDAVDEGLVGQRLVDGSPFLNLDENDDRLSDERFLTRIAKALGLPANLLALKANHLKALAAVAAIERRLETATRPKKT